MIFFFFFCYVSFSLSLLSKYKSKTQHKPERKSSWRRYQKKKKKDHLGVYVAPETFHLKIYQV